MAKVTHKPEPGTSGEHVQYGVAFRDGPVDVTDPAALAKFRGNPFYDVDGDDPGDEVGGLVAKHKGRGVYIVVKGDETVAEGLTKAEAEAYIEANASDE